MIRVLFVCWGNICRSPMCESVMTYLINQSGLDDKITVDSAATSTEEIGNPPHRGTVLKLKEEGIPLVPHRARQMTAQDYGKYDLLIGMEQLNIRYMMRIVGADPEGKIRTLLPRDVADPWYTGDFDSTYKDVWEGCNLLLAELEKKIRGI